MISLWFVYIIMLLYVCAYQDFTYKSIEKTLFSADSDRYKIFDGPNGSINYKNGVMSLNCYEETTIPESFPTLEKMLVHTIVIRQCILPPTPIIDDLKKLNINTDEIETLQLGLYSVYHTQEAIPQGNYTKGLNLKTFSIRGLLENANRNVLLNNPDILKPLSNVTSLLIYGTKAPPIPEDIKLEILLLDEADITVWKNCEYLIELNILSLLLVPEIWPANCKKLTFLRLKQMNLNTMDRLFSSGISEGSANVRKLHINFCELPPNGLVGLLNAAKDLEELNLWNNGLTDRELVDFPILRNLTSLDLSQNRLTGWALFDLVKKVPALRDLTLSSNEITGEFCSSPPDIFSFASHLSSLENLSMHDMPMDSQCFNKANFAKLKYLGLNTVFEVPMDLRLQSFPRTNETHLTVDLLGKKIVQVTFNKDDYETLRTGNFSGFWGADYNYKTNLTVQVSKIDCDCQNYWFARALREFPTLVSMPNLMCQNEVDFLYESLEAMNCYKHDNGDCLVRIWGIETETRTPTVTAKCYRFNAGEFRNPIYDPEYKLLSLNISNIELTSLDDVDMPESLESIDLRKNSLSRLKASDIDKLFANRNRKLWLSENLYICDCDNKIMLDAFHDHRNQIMDFDAVTCIDSDQLLRDVSSYKVCQISLRIALGTTAAVVLLMLTICVIIWRKRLQIKIYLYSRGWCLVCLTEEDIDEDKPYDAFLSFAHGDYDYVTENLLPELEREPDAFKICVHYRDWVIGDWIPRQIMRSVQLSKRTIIVLSKNFITSLWGSLEFRYAVANAAQENRKRLLVIVLDNVLSQPLDPELKSYLEFNTYLHYEDPLFWEKLRYAMPHRKFSPRQEEQERLRSPDYQPEVLALQSLAPS